MSSHEDSPKPLESIDLQGFRVESLVVPETGLEPALIAQPDPKSGASTNSATQALRGRRLLWFQTVGVLQMVCHV